MDWLLIWFVLTTGDIEAVQVEFETDKLCRNALQELQKKRPLGEKKSSGYCFQVRQDPDQREIRLPER
jgi:hypothetical protein